MICAQAIVHFRPKASYEKYLKMLMSAMILIQLLASLAGIFSSDGQQQLAERAGWFADSLEESMRLSGEESFWSGQDAPPDIMGRDPGEMSQEEREFQGTEALPGITVQIEPIAPIRIGIGVGQEE